MDFSVIFSVNCEMFLMDFQLFGDGFEFPGGLLVVVIARFFLECRWRRLVVLEKVGGNAWCILERIWRRLVVFRRLIQASGIFLNISGDAW